MLAALATFRRSKPRLYTAPSIPGEVAEWLKALAC
jgi:hypothetical protein